MTISGVTEPILSQRVVDQVIRLREGEASILGGIQDKQEAVNWSGIPGLSSIPILKYLFGSKDHTINDDELVFLVVPHIVRTQMLDTVNLRTVDTGAGTTVQLRHIASETPAAQSVPSAKSWRAQMNPPRSTVGTIPGQSAAAAGPAALQQMKKAADDEWCDGDCGSCQPPARPAAGSTHSTAGSADPGFNSTQAEAQCANPPQSGAVSLTITPLTDPVANGATFKIPVGSAAARISPPFPCRFNTIRPSFRWSMWIAETFWAATESRDADSPRRRAGHDQHQCLATAWSARHERSGHGLRP